MEQFATFYLNDTLFGLPILAVREITPIIKMTEVPLAPEYISGLINLRGQVVTIMDLGVKLGLGKRDISEKTRLIIIKTDGELSEFAIEQGIKTSDDPVGLLVDKIGDVISTEEEEIEPPPANMDIEDLKYVRGVIKTDEKLLTILVLNQLLMIEDPQETFNKPI